MPGHEGPLGLLTGLTSSPLPPALFGYVGLGPGQELLPYFLALLGLAGSALLAVAQWPLVALFRYLRRLKGGPAKERANEPPKADGPEAPEEGSLAKS